MHEEGHPLGRRHRRFLPDQSQTRYFSAEAAILVAAASACDGAHAVGLPALRFQAFIMPPSSRA